METAYDVSQRQQRLESGQKQKSCNESKRPDLSPLSIYHQPWWLDIATDGQWGETAIKENGAVIGRMPYPIETRFGLRVSRLPSLIRTLGPHVATVPGKPMTTLRRRVEIINQLIDDLPAFDLFDHTFDPRVADVLAFTHRDYVTGVGYSFRTKPGHAPEAILSDMVDTRRRVIRRAEAELYVTSISDIGEFCRFYDGNVGETGNFHGTGRMGRLLEAVQEREAGILLGAKTRQGKLAAAVGIVWDETAAHYFLGSRRPDLDCANGAISLLIWEAIKIASERGLTFDFDGATTPGLVRFLSGFGGQLTTRLRVRRMSGRFRTASRAFSLIGRRI